MSSDERVPAVASLGREARRREILYHVLPAWLSAIGAIGALALTAYTLLVVHQTSGQVQQIMTHMGIPPAGR